MSDFSQLYEEFQVIYKKLYKPFESKLSGVAEEYDRWFLNEFADMVKTDCTFKKGKFQPVESSVLNNLVQIAVKKATEIIYPPVSAYMLEYFDDFYRDGLELARINGEMDGKKIDTALTKDDKLSIELMVDTELTVWKTHIEKHKRQLDRELKGAVIASMTLDSFLLRMVARDTHVVAYPYGNSRLSWSEHIRRFLACRPRMCATTAQMRRML